MELRYLRSYGLAADLWPAVLPVVRPGHGSHEVYDASLFAYSDQGKT